MQNSVSGCNNIETTLMSGRPGVRKAGDAISVLLRMFKLHRNTTNFGYLNLKLDSSTLSIV